MDAVIPRRRRLLLGGAAAVMCGAARAQRAPTPAEREAKQRQYFTDTPLLAHDGRTLRFYSDVLKDRIVLVNFVFTECGEACPLITQKLIQTRAILGAQAREVRFASISIDPERDTPQTLTAFAKKQGAVDPEWLWFTGRKADVDTVTKRLGGYTDDRESHFTGLIVGNLRTDRWAKIRPDAPPNVIAVQLRLYGELDGKAGPAPVALQR